jgi:nucleoside phosphorylase
MDEGLHEPLLLFSQPVEMAACLEGIQSRTHVPYRAERVGQGRDAAHRVVHLLSEGPKPSAVLSVGSAGWLQLKGVPEVTVWASEVKSESGRTLRTTLGVPTPSVESLGFSRARLLSVRTPVLDYERAQQLAVDLGVDMVDMEGFSIATACLGQQHSCAVVRGVIGLRRSAKVAEHRTEIEAVMRRVGMSLGPLLELYDRREQERVGRARREA